VGPKQGGVVEPGAECFVPAGAAGTIQIWPSIRRGELVLALPVAAPLWILLVTGVPALIFGALREVQGRPYC
jgi:hypothetical protein